jgi:hypothetical protein
MTCAEVSSGGSAATWAATAAASGVSGPSSNAVTPRVDHPRAGAERERPQPGAVRRDLGVVEADVDADHPPGLAPVGGLVAMHDRAARVADHQAHLGARVEQRLEPVRLVALVEPAVVVGRHLSSAS